MKRFLKEMIGIMGLTILISSQSPAFAAEKIQQNESTSVYSGINIGNETSSDGFVFNAGTGDITITSYTGNADDVVVPAEINGRKVKWIAQNTFLYANTMKTLTFSEGIEGISNLFACNCSNLKKITLPSTATLGTVSNGGFYTGLDGFVDGCPALTEISVSEENQDLVVIDGILYNRELTDLIAYPAGATKECVVILDGISVIRGDAFAKNPYLKKVVFPDSVRTIGYWAFDWCSSLEEINIPPHCQLIGQYAFHYTAIKHITIPAGVTDAIMLQCFEMAPLETIEVEPGNTYYRAQDGALYSDGDTLLMYAIARNDTEFTIPEGINFISPGAFSGAKNLQKITIASTVDTISRSAFGECENLKEVSIKEGNLKKIEGNAFFDCYKLKTINIPDSVTSVGESAFCQCYSLTEIELPSSLTQISPKLFDGASQLTTVHIPDSIKSIGSDAFSWTNLKNIYYSGSEEQWAAVDKGDNDFSNVAVYYNGETCAHIWADDFTVDVEPFHTTEGQKSIHCTLCGLMKAGTEQVIPPLGHTFYRSETIIEAGCETEGKEICYCDCGVTEEKTIAPKGHSPKWYKGIRNNEELELWKCKYCDKVLKERYGTEVLEDGWIQVGRKQCFLLDGRFLCNQWYQAEDGSWYYFKDNEDRMTGWLQSTDTWYYFNTEGVMQTGWQMIGDVWYYFTGSGTMQIGWLALGNNWYYMDLTGAMVTGWQIIGNTWYYFDENGKMITGWLFHNSDWYYLTENGSMSIGWQVVGDKWYHFNESGRMQNCGWQQLGTTWYYLSESGAMVTGWLNLNGTWYYMTPSGSMAIGWCAVGNNWYYLSESGAMVTGWLNLSGTWYYMNINGAMLTGTHVIDGNNYIFDQNGAWVK